MFYEASLIAFTVLAQLAVGSYILINLGSVLKCTVNHVTALRFITLAVLGIGFIFSIFHLGSPAKAFNAFNRISASPLSNEIALGCLFMLAGGALWAMGKFNKGSEQQQRLTNAISMLLGVVFMYVMADVYNINTVPAWHSMHRFYEFGLTFITLGTVFGYLLLCLTNDNNPNFAKPRRIIAWFGISIIGINLALTTSQLLFYSQINTAIHSGAERLGLVASSIGFNLFTLAIAAALWIYSELYLSDKYKHAATFAVLLALLFAEIHGRNIFYAMHFTSGLS